MKHDHRRPSSTHGDLFSQPRRASCYAGHFLFARQQQRVRLPVNEPFLIPVSGGLRFSCVSPAVARVDGQHNTPHFCELMVASWGPGRTLSGPSRGDGRSGLRVCGDPPDLPDKVYLRSNG
jgi:hypothetical protein